MIQKICFDSPDLGSLGPVTPDEVLTEFRRLADHSRETLEFHMPLDQEEELLRFIQDGDPDGLAQWLHAKKDGLALGDLSDNQLLQLRCLFIGAITLYTRTAISGGLEQETAHNLCDAYVHVASNLTSPARLKELIVVSGLDFARRVGTARLSGIPAVKTCRAYIHNHLHYKITLTELAQVCALSPNYLSSLFRDQMGMGLKEYILQEKLEAAGRALVSSDRPVSEIAAQFAFCSHSSFAAHFKRKFGVSPTQYRLHGHL